MWHDLRSFVVGIVNVDVDISMIFDTSAHSSMAMTIWEVDNIHYEKILDIVLVKICEFTTTAIHAPVILFRIPVKSNSGYLKMSRRFLWNEKDFFTILLMVYEKFRGLQSPA